MLEADTTLLKRATGKVAEHKGKLAIGGTGGLSIFAALEIFCTKGELASEKEMRAQVNQDFRQYQIEHEKSHDKEFSALQERIDALMMAHTNR